MGANNDDFLRRLEQGLIRPDAMPLSRPSVRPSRQENLASAHQQATGFNPMEPSIGPAPFSFSQYLPQPVRDLYMGRRRGPVGGVLNAMDLLSQLGPGDVEPSGAVGGAVRAAAPVVTRRLSRVDAARNLGVPDPVALRHRYPEVVPPTTTWDPKKEKWFEKKTPSEEAVAVDRARKRVMRDIKAGNYDPLFPVDQRFYVNPDDYPIVGNTLEEAVPVKQSTLDEWTGKYNTPEAKDRLRAGYEAAVDDPLAHDWYAMGQLEQAARAELGDDAGREWFRRRFADAMAATTGGSDPTANLITAAFGNHAQGRGATRLPISNQTPYPVGGRYLKGNLEAFDRIVLEGQGIDAVSNPKRFNFSANFQGHMDRATMDEQMMGGLYPGHAAPQWYSPAERTVHEVASEYGVAPGNFQDVTWAGLKGVGGKPMVQHINEAMERTGRLTGQTSESALRRWIRRNAPVLGLGGLLGTGAATSGEGGGR